MRLATGIVALAIAGLGIFMIQSQLGPGGLHAIDLAVYREAGWVILHGGSPYAASFGRRPPSYRLFYPLPFTYPPLAALLGVPLTWARPIVDDWIWDIATLMVLAAVLLRATRWIMERPARAEIPAPAEVPAARAEGPAARAEIPTRAKGPTRAEIPAAPGPLTMAGAAPSQSWRISRSDLHRLGAVLAAGVVLAIAIWTRPVKENLSFGQVDIFLMGVCLLDTLATRPRWPRGVLVGLATAFQVAPGIFGLYFLLTGQWRALRNAIVTWFVATGIAFAVMPGPTVTYYTKLLFKPGRVGNVGYFSNQSLWGMLARAGLGAWHVPLLVLSVLVVTLVGMGAAAAIHRSDPSRRGAWHSAILVGLVWVLVSPVSWIHGMVWLLPAAIFLVGLAARAWQALLALVFAVPLCFRLPNVDTDPSKVHLPLALKAVLVDTYGLIAVVLLIALSWIAWRAVLRAGASAPRDQLQGSG